MMLHTTVGQILINDALPPDLRRYGATLDKKGAEKLLGDLIDRHPEQYRDVAHKLMQTAREAAYISGGNTFGLKHLRPAQATTAARGRIGFGLQKILANPDLSDDERQTQINQLMDQEGNALTKAVYDESLAEKNPIALQVLSGSRGNPNNLRSLRGFDVAYEDHHGNRIGLPILHNYSEGLSPAEYFAGAYGARRGVIDTKLMTANAGYIAKQFNQAVHRLLVTATDDESGAAPNTTRGLPISVHDPDNAGALLAQAVGGYPRNTVLTPKILRTLSDKGHDEILVRSPMVGGPPDGGVYARDVGVRERGRLAPLGDYVGIAAGQALAEKLTQGSLSSKHSGGVLGAGPQGFALINQLAQVPEHFPGGAAHAQRDGVVQSITEAPQGGHIVAIGGEEHYVEPDHKLRVKSGDEVEAGDVLSSGLPNPSEIVKHKGIGEGRRYFMSAFRDAYSHSNMPVDRRNIELVTRGLLDHVRLTDMWGDYAPDDVVQYHTLEHNWTPRSGTVLATPTQAIGKYLEAPVLHHTIGTRVRKSMLPQFQRFGVHNLQVHPDPPPFEPEMQRAATSISTDPDPFTRMLGSGQKGNLLDAVHRGDVSDSGGTSFVPALIAGAPFGKVGPTQGWKP
jgi:DNA-directed RNA polymerase subunit beta'